MYNGGCMPTPRYDMTGILVVRPAASGWEHLQLLRAPEDYMGNMWALCRGRCEGTETSVQAALRELREETGLRPQELYRLSTLEQFYTEANDAVWHVPFFVAVVAPDAEVVLNEEHTAYRWVADAEIDEQLTWPSERSLIAEVRAFILGDHSTKRLMRLGLE